MCIHKLWHDTNIIKIQQKNGLQVGDTYLDIFNFEYFFHTVCIYTKNLFEMADYILVKHLV